MSELKKAIAYFEDAVRESDEIIADCSPALQAELTEQKGHFVLALEIMRRAQPANDPLTPEQLREMDGEPVYIKYHTCGWWEIYQGFMHDRGLYGKTWFAYRRPPERSENDGL